MPEINPPADLLALASAENADAQCELGIWYARQGGDEAKVLASKWLARAAEAGSARGLYNLGVLELEGDREAARQYFYRAACEKYVPGMRALATMARDDRKDDTALRWFQIAANEGDVLSKFEVAHALMNSENPDDQTLFFRYASDAAHAGIPEGQALLATAFHEGTGTSRSPVDAFRWYLAAAVQQHAGAAAMLGVAYDVGAGTPENKVQAAKWILRAAALQSEIATAYWPRLARELSPDQIEMAKDLAKRPFTDDDA